MRETTSIEKIVANLKTELESVYSHREHFSEEFFSLCPICRNRIIDSIVEEQYFAAKNDCQECRPLREESTGKVIKLFEALGLSREDLQRDLKNRANRKSLIAILYGIFVNGPSVPLAFPHVCLFELTYRCNLRCKHCYIGVQPPTEEMDTGNALKVIGKIAETGFGMFELCGGEPLMRDDLSVIAKEIKSYGMTVNLSTNGTLLSQDKVRELKPYVDEAMISVDSHEESNHDNFRGEAGALKRSLEGIRNCVDNDIPVNIYTTLTTFIHTKLPEFVDCMGKLKVSSITFFDLNPVGKGSTVGAEFRLSLKDLEAAFCTLHKLKDESGVEIHTLAPFKFVMDEKALSKNTMLSGGFCNAGINSLSISPDGDLFACTRVRTRVGNALKDDIRNIWWSSPLLSELRDRSKLKGECGKCEYKYVCGGCRANAYIEHSDHLMEDPRCIC